MELLYFVRFYIMGFIRTFSMIFFFLCIAAKYFEAAGEHVIFFSAKEELDEPETESETEEEEIDDEDSPESGCIRSAQVLSASELLQHLMEKFEPLDTSKGTLTVGFVCNSIRAIIHE